MLDNLVRIDGVVLKSATSDIFVRHFNPVMDWVDPATGMVKTKDNSADWLLSSSGYTELVKLDDYVGGSTDLPSYLSCIAMTSSATFLGTGKPIARFRNELPAKAPVSKLQSRAQLKPGHFAQFELSDFALKSKTPIRASDDIPDITRFVSQMKVDFKIIGDYDIDLEPYPSGFEYVNGTGYCSSYLVPIVTDELRTFLSTIQARVCLLPIAQRRLDPEAAAD